MYPEVDFLYLNEQEMIKAGVKNMPKCIDTMEDVLKCLTKGSFLYCTSGWITGIIILRYLK